MPEQHAKAIRHLRRSDPQMAQVIRTVGPCTLTRRGGTFSLLAKSILSQQISTHAARTIRRRLEAVMPHRQISAAGVMQLSDADFQAVGVSQQKRRYLRDLADHVVNGQLSFRRLARLPDEDVISELIVVKGIGRWTAQMFLLAGLGRPDIFAPDDLGLQNAIQKIYSLRGKPSLRKLEAITRPWAPYRSVASWYLWQSLSVDE